jgi:hypothetical protein
MVTAWIGHAGMAKVSEAAEKGFTMVQSPPQIGQEN